MHGKPTWSHAFMPLLLLNLTFGAQINKIVRDFTG